MALSRQTHRFSFCRGVETAENQPFFKKIKKLKIFLKRWELSEKPPV